MERWRGPSQTPVHAVLILSADRPENRSRNDSEIIRSPLVRFPLSLDLIHSNARFSIHPPHVSKTKPSLTTEDTARVTLSHSDRLAEASESGGKLS